MDFDRLALMAALAAPFMHPVPASADSPEFAEEVPLAAPEPGGPEPSTLAGAPGGGTARSILPRDDRELVEDTTVAPYSAIGYIQAEDASGNFTFCTGVLVGPRTVLTAAHCLYDHDAGGWLADYLFAPALNGVEDVPFGVAGYDTAYVLSGYVDEFQGWYGSVVQWDLGVLVLDHPLGESAGWTALVPAAMGGETPVRVAGYPFDKPLGTMWVETCTAMPLDNSSGLLQVSGCYIDATASGAPVFGGEGDATAVIGVLIANMPEATIMLPLDAPLIAWIRSVSR